jgi:hypothetical protein
MNLSEALDIQGQLTLQKRTADDRIIEVIQAQNSIVLTGRDLVARLFIKGVQDTIKPVSHVAVGTGTNPVNPQTDRSLAKELFRKSIKPIDIGRDLQPVVDKEGITRKKVTITADLGLTEANDGLTEAALFTGDPTDTNAVMYNRVVFPVINKSKDFQLTLIWEILF